MLHLFKWFVLVSFDSLLISPWIFYLSQLDLLHLCPIYCSNIWHPRDLQCHWLISFPAQQIYFNMLYALASISREISRLHLAFHFSYLKMHLNFSLSLIVSILPHFSAFTISTIHPVFITLVTFFANFKVLCQSSLIRSSIDHCFNHQLTVTMTKCRTIHRP